MTRESDGDWVRGCSKPIKSTVRVVPSTQHGDACALPAPMFQRVGELCVIPQGHPKAAESLLFMIY